VKLQWQELGLTSTHYRLRDLWERTDVGTKSALEISLSEHASKLFRLSFVQRWKAVLENSHVSALPWEMLERCRSSITTLDWSPHCLF